MPVVSFTCRVDVCRFHNTPVIAEIAQTKAHIKSHDYRILCQIAFNLGIIENPDEHRSLDWLIDELFKVGRVTMGVTLL